MKATAAPGRAAADALVTEHLYLVQHAVNQLAGRYPRHVDRGELWSAGAYGLVDASRRYDPDSGTPFPRYAMIRIRGAIIDSTRDRDWATRRLRRTMRDVRSAHERFEAEHGRAPTKDELAELLDISIEQLEHHQASANTATLLHIDQTPPGNDSAESGIAGHLEERDTALLPEEAIENLEMNGTVRSAVGFLPEPQRSVVERYYYGGELLRDIADSMAVTEARVSQIRSEALDAMRAYFGTAFEGVQEVPASAPGVRRRAAYVEAVSEHSTWRTRLENKPVGEAERVINV
ncbi:MAG: sigma-70 family RNA polymerase sigma factor [Egibacteraceae bacterium]